MTAPAKKPKPRVAVVRGIKVALVDVNSVTAYLKALDVKIPSHAAAEHLIELYMDVTDAILEKLEKDESPDDYGECENCEAPCDPKSKSCPVCGKLHSETSSEVLPAPIEKTGDLDAAVGRIRGLIGDWLKHGWELGRELAAIHDSKLFRSRMDEGGRPLYRTWAAFCKAELHVERRQADNMMLIARKFSPQQAALVEPTKLALLAPLPESARAELIERAPSMSTRELRAVVKGQNGQSIAQNDARQKVATKNAEKARERREQADRGEAVTAVWQFGRVELPLSVAGKGFTAVEEIVNAVRVTYEFVVTGKRRVLRITRERIPDADTPATPSASTTSEARASRRTATGARPNGASSP